MDISFNEPAWFTDKSVVGPIHRADTMFDPNQSQAYMAVARSAIEVIDAALAVVDRTFTDVAHLLDFGCGYGRVLRLLAQSLDPARITAYDLDGEAARFCARAFGVNSIVSDASLSELNLGTFDLIWSGSVITHLDRDQGDQFLAFFERSLAPGGLGLFSFHGAGALTFLETHYGHEVAAQRDLVMRTVEKTGFAFIPYESSTPDQPYGVSFHGLNFIEERLAAAAGGLRTLMHQPQAWNNHQDVMTVFNAAD